MEPEAKKVVNPLVRIINTLAAHVAPNLNPADKANMADDLEAFNAMAAEAETEIAAKDEDVDVMEEKGEDA